MTPSPREFNNADRLDEAAATLCREIRALIKQGDLAGEEFYKAAGQRIKELKAHSSKWLILVHQECGIGRSRAFQLVAIAEGRQVVTDVRTRNAEANRRLRARRASRDGLALPVPHSTSTEVGAFLRQLGASRFFEALQHAPELRSEIQQRVRALLERKAAPETAIAAAVTRAQAQHRRVRQSARARPADQALGPRA
jgi:hypothetical protein